MGKIQKVVFGEDWLKVSADQNGYKLIVKSDRGTAIFDAASRQEMADIVSEFRNALNDIDIHINYTSVFIGLCENTEEEGKEDGKHEDL